MSARATSNRPVCVLGLGLIGGSLLRAALAAGREAFGYNRSQDGVDAARSEGFDTTADLTEALQRAAAAQALIVLAVPMPALPNLLEHIRTTAPDCPLTDVTSVKDAVLQAIRDHGLLERYVGGHPMTGTAHSGWAAGDDALFVDAPWVIAVDDHVDPGVWSDVMHLALDCGSVVVPARSDEHDAAVAVISHLPHVLAEALAVTAADVALGFSLAAGSFRDGTRVATTAPSLVRAMCEANSGPLLSAMDRAIDLLAHAREGLATTGSIADLVESGYAARQAYDHTERPQITGITVGEDGWRQALAAAGRDGGVVRSALQVLDSRG